MSVLQESGLSVFYSSCFLFLGAPGGQKKQLLSTDFPFKWLQIEFRATEGAAVRELIILHVKIKMMYFWDLM